MPTLNLQSFKRLGPSDILNRVSVAADGVQGTAGGGRSADSQGASFSADGRFVLFESGADNLVAGDTNGATDIFLKDLLTGALSRVSTDSNNQQVAGGGENGILSANGRYVVFESLSNGAVPGDAGATVSHVFRKDLVTGAVIPISVNVNGEVANADNGSSSVSADGRYIAFASLASNLTDNDSNSNADVFIKDTQTGVVTCLSLRHGQTQSGQSIRPLLSPDGKSAIFSSSADLAAGGGESHDIFRKKLETGAIEVLVKGLGGTPVDGLTVAVRLSANGQYLLILSGATNIIEGDSNNHFDMFRMNLLTGEIKLASVTASGIRGNNDVRDGDISADGRYVVYTTAATNQGSSGQASPEYSVFRKDMETGELVRISVSADGTPVLASLPVAISADGQRVIWQTDAAGVVPGDTNGADDVFVAHAALAGQLQAAAENRAVDLTLGVGSASSVTMAWGDGSVDAGTPVGGSAAFSHVYATTGMKAAVATVTEGALTWAMPHRVDLGAGRMARDTMLLDTLSGGAGADTLSGDDFSNRLEGNAGKDKISGGLGDDWLLGGLGKDALTGGKGRDFFVFGEKAKKSSLDTINDFRKEDSILLENAIFKGLGKKGSITKPKKLAKDAFTIGKTAQDAEDRMIYDKATGALFYDKDGAGGAAQVKIATLKGKAALTNADLMVI